MPTTEDIMRRNARFNSKPGQYRTLLSDFQRAEALKHSNDPNWRDIAYGPEYSKKRMARKAAEVQREKERQAPTGLKITRKVLRPKLTKYTTKRGWHTTPETTEQEPEQLDNRQHIIDM